MRKVITMKTDGIIKKGKLKIYRFYLLPVEFLMAPLFFFILLYGSFRLFNFKLNLLIYYSFLFFFSLTHISLFTGFKKYPLLKDDKNTDLLIYAGTAISMAFCIVLILTPDIYFSDGSSFSMSFSSNRLLIGTLTWGLSYILLGFLLFKTGSRKRTPVSIGLLIYGQMVALLGLGMPFICSILPLFGGVSLLMAIVSVMWADEDFIEESYSKNYCRNCGYELDEDSDYCENCGEKIR